MNNLKTWHVAAAVIVSGIAVFTGMFFFIGPLLSPNDSNAVVRCKRTGTTHMVVIRDDKLTPHDIPAKTCDVLMIMNQDEKHRLMAFGQHDNHVTYDGITEKQLEQGQSMMVKLTQEGTFIVHDHLDEAVEGTFTVTK